MPHVKCCTKFCDRNGGRRQSSVRLEAKAGAEKLVTASMCRMKYFDFASRNAMLMTNDARSAPRWHLMQTRCRNMQSKPWLIPQALNLKPKLSHLSIMNIKCRQRSSQSLGLKSAHQTSTGSTKPLTTTVTYLNK